MQLEIRHTSINVEIHSRDIGGVVRGEERHRTRDLLRAADPRPPPVGLRSFPPERCSVHSVPLVLRCVNR